MAESSKASAEDEFALNESNVRYYCRAMPALFVKGQNAHLWDRDGRQYIDFLSGCGALNYGHNHPFITARVIDYLRQDGVLCSMDFHTEAKRRLMEILRLSILEPRGLEYRVQFTGPTGANAVEAALKLARKVTGRNLVVAFTNAFHGMSAGALSITGSSSARKSAGICLNDVVRLPFDAYHGADVKDLVRFETMVRDPSGGLEAPAAFIVETVQGEGGLNVASVGWLRALAAMAKRLDALLIIDEIQTGCGRTGPFFSFERAGLKPDIVCLAKSIGGNGLPLAMALLRPELDVWQPGEHNGTFRGNNLAFVAATAALELWEDSSFSNGVARNAATLKAWISRVVNNFGSDLIFSKGLGMMSGVSFWDPAIARAALEFAHRRGLLIEAAGPYDQVLKIMPPLTIEQETLEQGLELLEGAIAEACNATAACPLAAE